MSMSCGSLTTGYESAATTRVANLGSNSSDYQYHEFGPLYSEENSMISHGETTELSSQRCQTCNERQPAESLDIVDMSKHAINGLVDTTCDARERSGFVAKRVGERFSSIINTACASSTVDISPAEEDTLILPDYDNSLDHEAQTLEIFGVSDPKVKNICSVKPFSQRRMNSAREKQLKSSRKNLVKSSRSSAPVDLDDMAEFSDSDVDPKSTRTLYEHSEIQTFQPEVNKGQTEKATIDKNLLRTTTAGSKTIFSAATTDSFDESTSSAFTADFLTNPCTEQSSEPSNNFFDRPGFKSFLKAQSLQSPTFAKQDATSAPITSKSAMQIGMRQTSEPIQSLRHHRAKVSPPGSINKKKSAPFDHEAQTLEVFGIENPKVKNICSTKPFRSCLAAATRTSMRRVESTLAEI